MLILFITYLWITSSLWPNNTTLPPNSPPTWSCLPVSQPVSVSSAGPTTLQSGSRPVATLPQHTVCAEGTAANDAILLDICSKNVAVIMEAGDLSSILITTISLTFYIPPLGSPLHTPLQGSIRAQYPVLVTWRDRATCPVLALSAPGCPSSSVRSLRVPGL